MGSRRNNLLYHLSKTCHLHLASFYAKICFEEKIARRNARFELRGPWPSNSTCLPKLVISWQDKNFLSIDLPFIAYKSFHNKRPNCFEGSFRLNSSVHSKSLRRSDDILLPLVKKSICRQSIVFTGSKHWNEIPPDVKNCQSLHSFKINLKKYFIEQY